MIKNTTQSTHLLFCFFIVLSGSFSIATAQTTDTIATAKATAREKSHSNVIKLNISAPIIYNTTIMGSYERVLSPKSSVSIYGGYVEFPLPTIINDSTNFTKNLQRSGFAIGFDYRFYLAKENKYAAPHGIYIAPFISYYSFKNTRNLATFDTLGHSATLQTVLNASFFNLGASLGYQFVIKNRFVIDMVLFGPSLTSYNFKLHLTGDTENIDLTEKQKEILDKIKNKFPLLDQVSKGQGISSSGVQAFTSFGFRYSVSIGYRF